MYTKGEWRLVTDAQGACMIMHPTEKGYALANLSDPFSPARGMWYTKDWHETYPAKKEEREANAHLIASAPELYEALKDLVDARWMYTVDWASPSEHAEIIERAKEALAKAEGGE